jgi:SET domain-containing protein
MAKKPASSPYDPNPQPVLDARFTPFRLRIGESKIHRWGVYAAEAIPARRKVIEYTGEKISRHEQKRRSNRTLNYLFTLNTYWAVDGSVGGSGAEFINHCCEPNCESRIFKGHILYYSVRDIRPGEELTVDYNFGADEEVTTCACGARGCRGTINLKKES